jgi:hypothetical protein
MQLSTENLPLLRYCEQVIFFIFFNSLLSLRRTSLCCDTASRWFYFLFFVVPTQNLPHLWYCAQAILIYICFFYMYCIFYIYMLCTFGEAPSFAKLGKQKGQVFRSCVYKNRHLLYVYVLSLALSLSLSLSLRHMYYMYMYMLHCEQIKLGFIYICN